MLTNHFNLKALDKMSSGMEDDTQLSEIMAAYDIPDPGDLSLPASSPGPLERIIPASPCTSSSTGRPVLDYVMSNVEPKASTVLQSLASMASPAFIEQPTGIRKGSHVKQHHQLTGASSFTTLGQQSRRHCVDTKGPSSSASSPSSLPSSSQFLGPASSELSSKAIKEDDPMSLSYSTKTFMDFRHQHEAAIEFDQIQEHSQPMLIYSKEDWPSPDPDLQNTNDTGIAFQHLDTPNIAPSGSLGSSHISSKGPVREARKSRSRGSRVVSTKTKGARSEGKKQKDPILQNLSFRPFSSIMTPEHKSLIAKGLSDSEKIDLLAELHELLKTKNRDSKRRRRAHLSYEKLEEERRKNRERKRRSRQDPFIEFRHIMTEEQRKQLLQPDLDPVRRETIMTELMAVKKWINREQKRTRRAHMTQEQRAEERRKSREYKRRARNNPLLMFKSVITERHWELLHQDLNQEEREKLVEELIELKKTKQKQDKVKRRARYLSEQEGREGNCSSEKQQQETQSACEQSSVGISNTDVNERIQPKQHQELPISDSTAGVTEEAGFPVRDDPQVGGLINPLPDPGFTASSTEGSTNCDILLDESIERLEQEGNYSKPELEKIKNKIRQRKRRANQTAEEREEERRKNRERSRMRRKKLAEIEKVVARDRSQFKKPPSSIPSLVGHQGGSGYDPWKAVNIKTEADSPQRNLTEMPNVSCSSSNQTLEFGPCSDLPAEPAVPWLTKHLMDRIRIRNRECTKKARANMTKEQRERERERNRERQRLRRLMQTPEERLAYTEKQRNLRRFQRQDPAYREKERERQRMRKKKLRESPFYRVHEHNLLHLRKSRKRGSQMIMPHRDNEEDMRTEDRHKQEFNSSSSEDISPEEYDEMEEELDKSDGKPDGEGWLEDDSSNDEKGEEEDESDSDYEILYGNSSVKDTEQATGLDRETRRGKEDLRLKISTSISGMHKIVPLNKE
nr:trichohyalin-like [Lytechinus pictus]